MKTKNKFLTAIVLCSMLLVALPAIAAAQEDETLDIYGNANEDDIIDMRDLTFIARMILGLEDETDLADANYDGRISVADMTQIGLIILGRESKLTLVDSGGRLVTCLARDVPPTFLRRQRGVFPLSVNLSCLFPSNYLILPSLH